MRKVKCKIFRLDLSKGLDKGQIRVDEWLEKNPPSSVFCSSQTESIKKDNRGNEVSVLTISIFYEVEIDPGVKE